MSADQTHLILLCAANADRVKDERDCLQSAGFGVVDCDSVGRLPDVEQREGFGVAVVIGNGDPSLAVEFCRGLSPTEDDKRGLLPVLVVTDPLPAAGRRDLFIGGADAQMTRPHSKAELLANVRSLLRMKGRFDELAAARVQLQRELNRFQFTVRRMDEELRFAHQIQLSFLPQELPNEPPVRFAVKFEVAGSVSGDFYDIIRLDHDRLAFYVCDAMGHGVPAGLLTIYVKKGILTKQAGPTGDTILAPNQVLERLNIDLMAQQLSENPFITMAYFTLNLKTLMLEFARAGHPYPLLVPAEGPIESLEADGTLLGVFENEYVNERRQLRPGDRLLVFTDGIDSVRYKDHRQGFDSFFACVDDLRNRPIDRFVADIYTALFPHARHEDDFTLLGIEVEPAGDS